MKIQLADPKATFDKHYTSPDNRRILFSGKFGIGKSYFLKDYFEVDKANDVNTFWLSPVKYSVSINEDIFEYIKFDLALKLIAQPEFAQSSKIRINEEQYLAGFLSSKPSLILEALVTGIEAIADDQLPDNSIEAKAIKFIPRVQKIAQDLLNKFEKYKEYKAEIDKASETINDIFVNYLKRSALKEGSVYEDDLVTQTIRSCLAICKEQTRKDNVFIIDDFDRLDPEHVFRILNILSVHNDAYVEHNKFGFDKIIVVCDYQNIKNIYAHKYGDRTDFEGYISKFYSTEIFHYNNYDAIQFFCEKELNGIITDKDDQDVVGLILSRLVKYKLLTMRDIVKVRIPANIDEYDILLEKAWQFPNEYANYLPIYRDNFICSDIPIYVSTSDLPFIKAIKLLIIICGGFSELKAKVTLLRKEDKQSYASEYVPKIVNFLMTTLNVVHNIEQQSTIVFSLERNRYQDGYVYLSPPTISIFNITFTIPIIWNKTKQYKGRNSYFEGVSHVLKGTERNINLEKFDHTFVTLFGYIESVVDFAGRGKNRINLGISTE